MTREQRDPAEYQLIATDDVRSDIDVLLWSMKLSSIRRFFHQRFWEEETSDAEYALRIEPYPRLESVAEHSWHVADAVLLVAPHFSDLDVGRCLALAVLHDKLEIIIGDRNPIGRDGTGAATHAFDQGERLRKEALESDALEVYLRKLRASARHLHAEVFSELANRTSVNARFVRAVDKLQALAFVVLRKKGNLEDRHLDFTLRYSELSVQLFPQLQAHYQELRSRLLNQVGERRGCTPEEVVAGLSSNQLMLPLGDDE